MCHNLSIHSSNKVALLYGLSSQVGKYCVELLLNNPAYKKVKVIAAAKPDVHGEKLEYIPLKDSNLKELNERISCDDLFICPDSFLNHSKGSESFVKINFLLPSQLAIQARKLGASQIILLSSIMALGDSYVLPLKIRADLEDTVKKLNFKSTYIFKTSVVLPKPTSEGLGANLANAIAKKIDAISNGFVSKLRPIEALDVASAMVNVPQQLTEGLHVIKNDQINSYVNIKS